jgi:aminoglycoside phosphotransferase (APT) family kinase protein
LVSLRRAALEVETVLPRFAHGDLAPVNLLVRDGRVAAVLDLDRARLAHPLHDAAWFAWVVSFHHRDVAGAAWSA